MITRPGRAAVLGVVLGAAAACVPSEILCGCVMPPPTLLAEGTVNTAAGLAVVDAVVSARVMRSTCDPSSAVVVPAAGAERPRTSTTGTYQLSFSPVFSTEEHCVRIVAERAAGDSVRSDTAFFSLQGGYRRQIDLRFP